MVDIISKDMLQAVSLGKKEAFENLFRVCPLDANSYHALSYFIKTYKGPLCCITQHFEFNVALPL